MIKNTIVLLYPYSNALCSFICIKTQAVLIFERMFILVQGVAGWKRGMDGGPSTPPIVTADTR